jgi:hypothetical protein
MDMKKVLEHVRGDLRKRTDSHFFEVYFRIRERGASRPTYTPPSTRC